MRKGLFEQEIEVVPYDENWALYFVNDKALLSKILRNIKMQIEHVGSTSVPGLSAKPSIDIMIGLHDIADMEMVVCLLEQRGFKLGDINRRPQRQNLTSLSRANDKKEVINYLHITSIGGTKWNNFICFRDFLREFPEAREKYQATKYASAGNNVVKNIRTYYESKKTVIEDILYQARRYYEIKDDEQKDAKENKIWQRFKQKRAVESKLY